jgi:tetratricopeptide (TPR) repeat protein
VATASNAARTGGEENLRLAAQFAVSHEDYGEAERLLSEHLKVAPEDMEARFEFVRVSCLMRKPEAMLPALEELIAKGGEVLRYRIAAAAAHSLLGHNEVAIEIMEEVVGKNASEPVAWLNHGHVLRAAGCPEAAVRAYRQCIALRHDFGDGWLGIADLKTHRLSAEDADAMEGILRREDLDYDERLKLEFSLGRGYEDQGESARAFEHYARGNALKRDRIRYEHAEVSSLVGRTCAIYTRHFFRARTGWGLPNGNPIFLVGVPRSGSTLVEQILASHSEVVAAGELPDVTGFAVELWSRGSASNRCGYPETVGGLSQGELAAFAGRYFARGNAAEKRLVDKMLCNFMHVGLIHLMFPNAAIVDVRRDPLACGLSCFKQLFNHGQKFTYDLWEMGRYYRDYLCLMDHFDVVLPGRIHHISYESLVAAPELEVQRLLQYCGLPFEEGCLRFHENRRAIHTISSEQVRRPIYSESVDAWRSYERWLTPMKEGLAGIRGGTSASPTPGAIGGGVG